MVHHQYDRGKSRTFERDAYREVLMMSMEEMSSNIGGDLKTYLNVIVIQKSGNNLFVVKKEL